MTQISKGDFVTYRAGVNTVEAIVRRAHNDGSATIETRHFLNDDGTRQPGYLGYKLRLPICDLTKQGAGQ